MGAASSAARWGLKRRFPARPAAEDTPHPAMVASGIFSKTHLALAAGIAARHGTVTAARRSRHENLKNAHSNLAAPGSS